MTVGITAIGTTNPAYKRAQLETADLISAGLNLRPAEKRILKSVYKASGIEYRHSVLADYCKSPGEFEFFPNLPDAPFPSTSMRMRVYKENALTLALSAIHHCALDAQTLNSITHVITVSCTGMYAPGIDIEIVQQLNLHPSTKRTTINFMGCYGAFNALKMAESICKAEPDAKVLVVCVEICTIHFQKKMSLDNIISNAIFSDGAAAVLIQETRSNIKKSLNLETFHCDLLPKTSQEMAWTISDEGFDIVLSSYVPQVIESGIAEFVRRLLSKSNISMSEIDYYAIHPGGLKVLQACETALNLNETHNRYSYQVLREYGNMSSATILFVLKSIWDDIKNTDHQKKIFSCAFGPGLTLESMLLRMHYV